MICKHPENIQMNKCFIPNNCWNKPCNDCPCPDEAKKYMETDEAKRIYARSKVLLDRIEKEMI